MPVSGQTRYLVGFECRGFNKDTIRASFVAFLGRMKSLSGFADSVGNTYRDLDEAVEVVGALDVVELAPAFDLVVLAIIQKSMPK